MFIFRIFIIFKIRFKFEFEKKKDFKMKNTNSQVGGESPSDEFMSGYFAIWAFFLWGLAGFSIFNNTKFV